MFYLNSYLCEAKSSLEIPVLCISIREEETNHLAQRVRDVWMRLNIQHRTGWAAPCVFICKNACVFERFVLWYLDASEAEGESACMCDHVSGR